MCVRVYVCVRVCVCVRARVYVCVKEKVRRRETMSVRETSGDIICTRENERERRGGGGERETACAKFALKFPSKVNNKCVAPIAQW
jgi:hypothetical protein